MAKLSFPAGSPRRRGSVGDSDSDSKGGRVFVKMPARYPDSITAKTFLFVACCCRVHLPKMVHRVK
jgi:hypothetical protein